MVDNSASEYIVPSIASSSPKDAPRTSTSLPALLRSGFLSRAILRVVSSSGFSQRSAAAAAAASVAKCNYGAARLRSACCRWWRRHERQRRCRLHQECASPRPRRPALALWTRGRVQRAQGCTGLSFDRDAWRVQRTGSWGSARTQT